LLLFAFSPQSLFLSLFLLHCPHIHSPNKHHASSFVHTKKTQPLVAPTIPPRFYFLFGAPVETDPALAADRAACAELYAQIRGDVENGMGYLLRKRHADPYGDFFKRTAYEASWGWEKRAPSFEP
jgi:hypothetical protein